MTWLCNNRIHQLTNRPTNLTYRGRGGGQQNPRALRVRGDTRTKVTPYQESVTPRDSMDLQPTKPG